MKKLAALLISLAMILAMAVTGCSSSGSGQTASPQPSQPAGSQTPAAGGDYPQSRSQVVVPFSAGGGTDLFARIVVDKMSQIVGVPIEVVNVPGGSATIGTTQVANANTDGYTIGFSISTPLCVTPLLGETSYTLEDMQPICNAYTVLHGIYVAADSPIQDVDDLIAFINERRPLSYRFWHGQHQHMCLEECLSG
jgi:tripartite-type tricarboxylate transporter receptor subunit TctC